MIQDDVFARGGYNYQYDDIGQLIKDKPEKINFDIDGDDIICKTIQKSNGLKIDFQTSEGMMESLFVFSFHDIDAFNKFEMVSRLMKRLQILH